MTKEIRPFSGEFIKDKGYVAYEDLQGVDYAVEFSKKLYKKASRDVERILGKKTKYSVCDVVRFFQSKYQAYRVPWLYAMWYEESSLDIVFDEKSERHPDSMNPFDYSSSSGEKNITLVIDTVFNKKLRKKYSNIEKLEKQRAECEEVPSNEVPRCNLIIVIGYREKGIINSLCQCNNYCLMEDGRQQNIIPDIQYEMWYFYHHS